MLTTYVAAKPDSKQSNIFVNIFAKLNVQLIPHATHKISSLYYGRCKGASLIKIPLPHLRINGTPADTKRNY